VVLTALTVPTTATRDARFESDMITGLESVNGGTYLDDFARTLMTEYQRFFNHVVTDLAVCVIVNVGTANTDVSDRHQNFVVVGSRSFPVLHLEMFSRCEDYCAHGCVVVCGISYWDR